MVSERHPFAKAIYNRMLIHFEEHYFLEEVQSTVNRHGPDHVAKQLINGIMKTTNFEIFGTLSEQPTD